MDFKIGVMADSFKLDILEGIRRAAELGAQGVQVYATEGDMAPENMTDAMLGKLQQTLKENNIVVSALCGDFGGHGFVNAEENKTRIEKSKRILDLAKALDCNIVTSHIGVIPEEEDDTRKIMREACIELAEYADKTKAYFAMETGQEKCHILRGFLDSLGSRGVAVNYDPANLVMVAGDDEVAGVSILKDYIVHTHAKDGVMLVGMDPKDVYGRFAEGGIEYMNAGRTYLETPLGQGNVRFDAYLKALSDIGYNGFLTIERECGDDPAADIALAVDFLKEKIFTK